MWRKFGREKMHRESTSIWWITRIKLINECSSHAVLSIRDGSRICRSVLLTYGCGFSGSCSFRQWLSRCRQIISFILNFLLITFWKYIYISLQRREVIKKQENRRNQCFSYFFADPGGPKNPGSTDPDPQHWFSLPPSYLIPSTPPFFVEMKL